MVIKASRQEILVTEFKRGGGELAAGERIVLADVQLDILQVSHEALEEGVAARFLAATAQFLDHELKGLHRGCIGVFKVGGGGPGGHQGEDFVLRKGRIGAQGVLGS